MAPSLWPFSRVHSAFGWNEKIGQDLVRHGGEASAEHARDTAAIIARLEDLTEESKAQREGLLVAIDRLPPAQGS